MTRARVVFAKDWMMNDCCCHAHKISRKGAKAQRAQRLANTLRSLCSLRLCVKCIDSKRAASPRSTPEYPNPQLLQKSQHLRLRNSVCQSQSESPKVSMR